MSFPTSAAESAAGPARRIEPAALAGVVTHDVTIFKRYWVSTTFAAVVEPTIYLLAFGFGFGSLVSTVGGYRYRDFVGTGVVASAVLFTTAFASMFTTFVRREYQHGYEALLAAPVDVPEIVLAESLWVAVRGGVYSSVPLLVAVAFGLPPGVGMLLVPLIAFLTGVGWAFFGVWAGSSVPSMDSFNYIITAVITPTFLLAGSFFPVSQLPGWVHPLALANPLYHCLELVRHAVFGLRLVDLAHVGALVLFAGLMWLAAVRGMTRRLID